MSISKFDVWAIEARKHHLSYGQYVAAVERHGTLQPPKGIRKSKQENCKRTQICKTCGTEFELKTRIYNGRIKYSEAKYCDDCRAHAQCYSWREKVK